jgi:hypothetical protein
MNDINTLLKFTLSLEGMVPYSVTALYPFNKFWRYPLRHLKHYCLLGCEVVLQGEQSSTFQRILVPSSSGPSSPERTKQYILSKYQEPLTRRHSVRSKKTSKCSSTILRSWNLAKDVLVSCAICYRNVLQTFLQLFSNLCQRISLKTVERLSLLDHSHSSLYIFCRSSHVTKSITMSLHPIHRKIIFFLALNKAVSRQYATMCYT